MRKKRAKIFLSYAHEDIGMAKRIYQDLKGYGLYVWFGNESLLTRQDWEMENPYRLEIFIVLVFFILCALFYRKF
jgi:hypothetical protein